ncbi:MAG: DUF4838 domain-containing protein [Pirellulaceae bacterium]
MTRQRTFLAKLSLLLTIGALCASARAAEKFLVKDGKANAEIVIAENPPRSTRFAAFDLQTYVEKISGAKLPIATAPHADVPLKIYVGQSPHTEKLGVTDEGLKYGAYRIVSGDDWLALIGDDADFVPREPWAKNNGDRASGWLQREWEKVAGEPTGAPNGGMYKNRTWMTGVALPADAPKPSRDEMLELWGFDERGSFNAVCGFLRGLGVRWYLPGELGEVVPRRDSIPLPEIDETVKPDFEVRRFNVRFSTASDATTRWAMRLGMRDPYGLMVAHGMHNMTQTDTILREHPDWFAMYGGRRDNQPGERLNHLCYSNKELFDATVRWARAQFDQYDYESVSIMPPDAYISICQCPLCQGKDSPERGSRGKLSNHVWDFVNRVAKEVRKTHPEKKIVCCAYGANTAPPTNIDRLEPNVQVVIVGGRRPRSTLPEQREEIRQLRNGWAAKTQLPLMVFENYPITDRGFYLPAFVARTIGESINATKGVSRGEDIWLSFGRDFDTKDVGFNHFQVYFTARMYWGGPQQDVTAMLEEYCRLFYGPAGEPMLSFFNYCEDNWQDMEQDKAKVDQALALFAAAKSRADADSIYGRRLALIDEFLQTLRSKSAQLGKKRGPVPKLRTVWDADGIQIDGKLDDEYWQNCPVAATCSFRELQTGRPAVFGTSVKSGWSRSGDLYFAIRCEENPGEPLNIATTKPGDQALWYGDVVEILLETDSHSYYQIAVNPAGVLLDLDRGADKSSWYDWSSQAEVATHVADDHWIVEIRIPVTDDQNDPLNQVIGRKPSASLPWHINLCRQRIRQHGTELSGFSPTGAPAFHKVMKFAHFYDGRSQQFEHDEAEDDYLRARNEAEQKNRGDTRTEALEAFVNLASRDKLSDFQKCDALEQAAAVARAINDYERADKIALQAPIEAVAKTIRMQNLLTQRKSAELVEQYAAEDLSKWPFWNAGEAYFTRGRAYVQTGDGRKAEADLKAALPLTPDNRTQLSILRTLGDNRERNLKDDNAALEAYLRIVDSTQANGSSEYYYGVLGAARILTRQSKFDDALAALHHVDIENLRGTWRGSMLLALGSTLAAAGRTDDALAAYMKVASDDDALRLHRETAQQAIADLQK